jgi:type I restriction enzyme S subunit
VIDSARADYRFVYYYLQSQYAKLVDLKNGGAQQNLNAKLIKDYRYVWKRGHSWPRCNQQDRINN